MKLIFHLPEGKVEEFTVEKNSVSVGRGNVCDVVIPLEGFSRKHAQIELVDGEIFVTDLASTNGVYIDGQRIPANTRTQMQSFLNLQIGPAQQVEVLEDTVQETPVNIPVRESTRTQTKAPRKTEGHEQTKTTQMDSRLLKRPKKSQEKGQDGQNKMAMILLPILILAGASYYFFMNGEEASEAPEVAQEAAPVVVPLTQPDFLSTAMLESLMKDKSCQGDKASWCKNAGVLEASKEGVVIEGKTLVVYMNMTTYKNNKYSEAFNALDENQRLEILTMRRIFNSTVIRALSRQTALDTIQVVTGMEEQGELKIRMALKVKRDIDMKKAEKFHLYDQFDLILNEGKLENLSELTSLYDKLPL